MCNTSRVSGPLGSVWIEEDRVLFADRHGVRELPIPAELDLPPPPALGADARQKRLDWKAMAEVEIAPYTQLCRMFRAALDGSPAPSPVPLASFIDGLENMRVMDAIRASAGEGGAVRTVDQF
jgi:hypothetical protein